MKNIVQNIYYSGFNELMLLKKRFYTVKLIFFPEKNFSHHFKHIKKNYLLFQEKKIQNNCHVLFFSP